MTENVKMKNIGPGALYQPNLRRRVKIRNISESFYNYKNFSRKRLKLTIEDGEKSIILFYFIFHLKNSASEISSHNYFIHAQVSFDDSNHRANY